MVDGLESGTFDRAVERHRAGRLEDAETLYRQVLASDPRHADALHLRGVAALQLGRYDEALQLIEDAIVAKPDAAAYRLSLGQVHSAKSRLEDAVAAYRQATELAPTWPTPGSVWGSLFKPPIARRKRSRPIGGWLCSSQTTLRDSTISPAHSNFADNWAKPSSFTDKPWNGNRTARRRTTI